jgi:hypothetical protein
MGDLKTAIKTAVLTLAVIYVMNQWQPTRNLVQTALIGR